MAKDEPSSVTCTVRTEEVAGKVGSDLNRSIRATGGRDFQATTERVEFKAGVTSATVAIPLLRRQDDPSHQAQDDDDLMFKVLIEDVQPKTIFVSKKNAC